MGRTYQKNSGKYYDDDDYNRSFKKTKPVKHSNNRKTQGMKTLNNYVEDDYDSFDEYDDTETYEDDNT